MPSTENRQPEKVQYIGRVKFFDATKGFGFINLKGSPPFGGNDAYVNERQLQSKRITDNDWVICQVEASTRKPGTLEAKRVWRLKDFPESPNELLQAATAWSWHDIEALFQGAFIRQVAPFLIKRIQEQSQVGTLEKTECKQILRVARARLQEIPLQSVEAALVEKMPLGVHALLFAEGILPTFPPTLLESSQWPLNESILRALCSKEILTPTEKTSLLLRHIDLLTPDLRNTEVIFSLINRIEEVDKQTSYCHRWVRRLPATAGIDEFKSILVAAKKHFGAASIERVSNVLIERMPPDIHASLFAVGLLPTFPPSLLDAVQWPLSYDILSALFSYEDLALDELASLLLGHIDLLPPNYQNTELIFSTVNRLDNEDQQTSYCHRWVKRFPVSLDPAGYRSLLFSAKNHFAEAAPERVDKLLTKSMPASVHASLFAEGILSSYPPTLLDAAQWPLAGEVLRALFSHGRLSFEDKMTLLDGHIDLLPPSRQNTELIFSLLKQANNEDQQRRYRQQWAERLPNDELVDFVRYYGTDSISDETLLRLLNKSNAASLSILCPALQKEESRFQKILSQTLSTWPTLSTVEQRDSLRFLSTFSLAHTADSLPNFDSEVNKQYVQTLLWLKGEMDELKWDQVIPGVRYLSDDNQLLFLRRAFFLHATERWVLSTEQLKELLMEGLQGDKHEPFRVQFTLRLAIELIAMLAGESSQRLRESDLLKLVYDQAAYEANPKEGLRIMPIFEACAGRMHSHFPYHEITRWIRPVTPALGPVTEVAICFNYDPDLVAEVKKIPGRRFDLDSKHWIVPRRSHKEIQAFAEEHKFAYDVPVPNTPPPAPKGGHGPNTQEQHEYEVALRRFMSYNRHLLIFDRGARPKHVRFCEGQKALVTDREYGLEFWWCGNRPCFGNCQTDHLPHQWEDYTLLDMLHLLCVDLDERKKSTDEVIPLGRYYQVVGYANRLEALLKHLFCTTCGTLLHPAASSDFAYYRVTTFYCPESSCTFDDKVYLHHCFNEKCKSIIDSRISKKCPNGWYICAEGDCGRCCSTSVFERRAANLQEARGYAPHVKLQGHLEEKKYFCYRCGSQKQGGKCPKCNASSASDWY